MQQQLQLPQPSKGNKRYTLQKGRSSTAGPGGPPQRPHNTRFTLQGGRLPELTHSFAPTSKAPTGHASSTALAAAAGPGKPVTHSGGSAGPAGMETSAVPAGVMVPTARPIVVAPQPRVLPVAPAAVASHQSGAGGTALRLMVPSMEMLLKPRGPPTHPHSSVTGNSSTIQTKARSAAAPLDPMQAQGRGPAGVAGAMEQQHPSFAVHQQALAQKVQPSMVTSAAGTDGQVPLGSTGGSRSFFAASSSSPALMPSDSLVLPHSPLGIHSLLPGFPSPPQHEQQQLQVLTGGGSFQSPPQNQQEGTDGLSKGCATPMLLLPASCTALETPARHLRLSSGPGSVTKCTPVRGAVQLGDSQRAGRVAGHPALRRCLGGAGSAFSPVRQEGANRQVGPSGEGSSTQAGNVPGPQGGAPQAGGSLVSSTAASGGHGATPTPKTSLLCELFSPLGPRQKQEQVSSPPLWLSPSLPPPFSTPAGAACLPAGARGCCQRRCLGCLWVRVGRQRGRGKEKGRRWR